MPFPLKLFEVPAYDVHNIDNYEDGFAHDVALMKNALLRAANAIHAHAPHVTKANLRDFVTYTKAFVTMLRLSQTGEQEFLWPRLAPHIPIAPSADERAEVEDRMDGFDEPLADGCEDFELYDGSKIQRVLEGFGDDLREQMKLWIESVRPEQLKKCGLAPGELKELVVQDVVFIGQSMGQFLELYLPWLVAHADVRVNAYWPPLPPADAELCNELAQEQHSVWQFAPFDPVTREPRF